MKTALQYWLREILLCFGYLIGTELCAGQSHNASIDSMLKYSDFREWKSAQKWAVKAAEADSSDRSLFYYKAAEYASIDRDAKSTLDHLEKAIKFRKNQQIDLANIQFSWLYGNPRFHHISSLTKYREVSTYKNGGETLAALDDARKVHQEFIKQAEKADSSLLTEKSATLLYEKIKLYQPQITSKLRSTYQYAWCRLNDSIDVPYIVQLPKNYDFTKKYSLIVVLHGAVTRQKEFPALQDSTSIFFGRWFKSNASESNMIAVYPYSTNRYNWMMPDDGFDIVPNIINQVKKMYPIDDSKVYITGHSNGATGAFSYFVRHPSEFASFSGINNRPQVRTGGTFFRNGINRSFFNVSTDFDYYYPLEGHRKLDQLADSLNINWINTEIQGNVTHGYLIATKDVKVDTVYKKLFAQLTTTIRNPFSPSIYWECDNIRFGRCDWIQIDELDTLSKAKPFQRQVNFVVTGWRNLQDAATQSDSTSLAFNFPRKSGAVSATYSDNIFEIQASKVGKVTVYISPEMVDLRKPVQVKVNGAIVFEGPVIYDRDFMISSFKNSHDSQAVWISRLTIKVPK